MAPDTTNSQNLTGTGVGSGRGLTLHLGVLVQPYRSVGKKAKALTTADVAEILEAKYGVMAAFYRVHERDVQAAIDGSLEGAFEALLMKRTVNPWDAGMQKIQQSFRDFISTKEAENVGIPGTPTKAALAGVNHRLRHPYARRNPRRPSFRDTGLYMASFRAWID